jgi:hypothetical protein
MLSKVSTVRSVWELPARHCVGAALPTWRKDHAALRRTQCKRSNPIVTTNQTSCWAHIQHILQQTQNGCWAHISHPCLVSSTHLPPTHLLHLHLGIAWPGAQRLGQTRHPLPCRPLGGHLLSRQHNREQYTACDLHHAEPQLLLAQVYNAIECCQHASWCRGRRYSWRPAHTSPTPPSPTHPPAPSCSGPHSPSPSQAPYLQTKEGWLRSLETLRYSKSNVVPHTDVQFTLLAPVTPMLKLAHAPHMLVAQAINVCTAYGRISTLAEVEQPRASHSLTHLPSQGPPHCGRQWGHQGCVMYCRGRGRRRYVWQHPGRPRWTAPGAACPGSRLRQRRPRPRAQGRGRALQGGWQCMDGRQNLATL